jgi:hypothetical protein
MVRLDEYETAYLRERETSGAPYDEQSLRFALNRCTEDLRAARNAQRADIIARERASSAAFAETITSTWREGLEELSLFLDICEKAGRTLLEATVGDIDLPWKRRALFATHGRCLRVAREVECLLVGGFADGALGRWRTLHELSTVMGLLLENDDTLARRYVLHRVSQNYRASVSYQLHHQKTNSPPISDEVIARLKDEADELILEFGRDFSKDWGWAAQLVGKARVTFADLENRRQRDGLRPNYKWASDDIHGGFIPSGGTLGTDGEDVNGLLVGPSVFGLLDPAHWTALSLMDATTSLLLYRPTLDRLAMAALIKEDMERVRDAFYAAFSGQRADKLAKQR